MTSLADLKINQRLDPYDRAVLILRYIHQTPDRKHKITHICRDLGLPYNTINKSITQDYPECFYRINSVWGIGLTGIMPDNRVIDLTVPVVYLRDDPVPSNNSHAPVEIPSKSELPKPAKKSGWRWDKIGLGLADELLEPVGGLLGYLQTRSDIKIEDLRVMVSNIDTAIRVMRKDGVIGTPEQKTWTFIKEGDEFQEWR